VVVAFITSASLLLLSKRSSADFVLFPSTMDGLEVAFLFALMHFIAMNLSCAERSEAHF